MEAPYNHQLTSIEPSIHHAFTIHSPSIDPFLVACYPPQWKINICTDRFILNQARLNPGLVPWLSDGAIVTSGDWEILDEWLLTGCWWLAPSLLQVIVWTNSGAEHRNGISSPVSASVPPSWMIWPCITTHPPTKHHILPRSTVRMWNLLPIRW